MQLPAHWEAHWEASKAHWDASKGLSGEISADPPHCRLAGRFKQLRVIFPQQTAINAHCQYVQINISGETVKDIMVHASSQTQRVLSSSLVLGCSFFFLFKYISISPIKP